MKKYFWCILASLCCICLLFGCGSQEETKHEKKEKKEETTTVEQIETTETSTVTTEKATTTELDQTTTLKAIKLDNKLQGAYKVEGIEFSAPAYFTEKKENEDSAFLTDGDIGICTFDMEVVTSLDFAEKLFEEDFKNFSDIKEIETHNAFFADDECEYSVYKASINDVNIKIYYANYYDSKSEKYYMAIFTHNDSYTYDFESDFLSILKSIKMIDNFENKDTDSIKINSTFLSKDWSGNTVLVIEYNWTNTSNDAASFLLSTTRKCFQNGIECEKAYFCDDVDSGEKMKEVMPGYSLTVREAYVLNDMSDVTLQCSKFLSSTPFLETTIKLS